ncbi:MAG: EamA family transporter RarD [Verrucomicrobia bacterium]|nr:EamA family transporter RarD [Verrucomicrobiota bacterium]
MSARAIPADATGQAGRRGLLVGFIAFLSWGLVPLYWRLLGEVSSVRIVCHRAVWCFAFIALVVAASATQRDQLRAALRQPRAVWLCALAGWLIGINWLVFIWAVNHERVLQSSLGYYLSPLVTVALGAVALHERLPRLRWIAVACAGTGVILKVVASGEAPTIALALCGTWGCYALVKRFAGLDTITGLVIESAALLPPAILLLAATTDPTGPPFLGAGWTIPLLLVGGGPLTALPLLCYAYATRRLTLATLGLMQYLTPTMTFLLGVFLYREPFGRIDFVMFAFIWVGLTLYSLAPIWSRRAAAATPSPSTDGPGGA